MELGLYSLNLRAGYHLLAARRWMRGLRYLVEPVSYWRSLEFRLVWEHGNFRAGERVLDVGSPKPFSLYLARSIGAVVDSTDIEDYFMDEFSLLRNATGVPAERMPIRVEDGRRLSYADGQFDKVYSVSVMEHIPDDGDSQCARELGRVLAPGGSCLITVPFWPTSKDVYRKPNFYWSGVSGPEQEGLVFFQRRYSADDLQRRLIVAFRPRGGEGALRGRESHDSQSGRARIDNAQGWLGAGPPPHLARIPPHGRPTTGRR